MMVVVLGTALVILKREIAALDIPGHSDGKAANQRGNASHHGGTVSHPPALPV